LDTVRAPTIVVDEVAPSLCRSLGGTTHPTPVVRRCVDWAGAPAAGYPCQALTTS
jgi:hypothetical protein